MASSLRGVVEQFLAVGMPPIGETDIRLDTSRWNRYGPKKKAFYKVFEHTTRSGKVIYTGFFGQGSENYTVEADDDQALSDVDIKEIQATRARVEEQDRLRREATAKRAAGRAHNQWQDAVTTMPNGSVHGYVARKQIQPEGARYSADGQLLIRLFRYDEKPPRLVGLQKILPQKNEEGLDKLFNSGFAKEGAACCLGEPVDGQPILMGEGYATCCSVRMATNHDRPVVVALDSGNLLHAARVVRKRWPNSPILICGDDDYLPTKKGEDNHAGQLAAQAACNAVPNCRYLLPVFSVRRRELRDDETLPKLTDFNDLHIAEGLDAVRVQVETALGGAEVTIPTLEVPLLAAPPEKGNGAEPITFEHALARFALVFGSTNVWDDVERVLLKKAAFYAVVGAEIGKSWFAAGNKRQKRQTDLPKAKRAGDAEALEQSRSLLNRYTLLYGTETVWDADVRMVLSLSAMRAAWGSDAVKFWQESPVRKMIDADKLVFDPTERIDPETHVNLFSGMPVKAVFDEDLADPIIALSLHLCNGDAEIHRWLMQWLALPLRQQGKKMHTSVLMFGERQGTGKSLFFEGVIKAIYGEYGTTIGQHQLDSQFTAWQSRRLFVLAEEVVSRAEKYTHIGTIKHLITGRTVRINEKNMPEREESNHANVVFLSNEVQPLHLELDDRRFLVIEPKTHLSVADQEDLKRTINPAAIAAFYGYLMRYPIAPKFDERAKPPMTEAKERLIEYGLPSWQTFHRDWRDGLLFVPYCSCKSEDLYKAYRRWCERGNERSLSLTKFAGLIASRETKVRKKLHVGANAQPAIVFLIGTKPDDGPEIEWLTKQCDMFAFALREGTYQGTGCQE